MSTNYSTILYEAKENKAIISLNRLKQLNAINDVMAQEVLAALNEAEKDSSVNAVIIRGEGGNFSSGVDLKEVFDLPQPIGDEPSEVWRKHLNEMVDVSMKMFSLEKPVVAVVEGFALGGAADWVLSADIVLATEDAKFGEPEVKFGSAPPTLMMPWVVGIKKTKELLFTGDIIDAKSALDLGIYNHVVAKEDLQATLDTLMKKLVNMPTSVLRITKKAINKVYEMQNIRESIDYNLEAALSIFFLATEKEVAQVREDINSKGLGGFLKPINERFED